MSGTIVRISLLRAAMLSAACCWLRLSKQRGGAIFTASAGDEKYGSLAYSKLIRAAASRLPFDAIVAHLQIREMLIPSVQRLNVLNIPSNAAFNRLYAALC